MVAAKYLGIIFLLVSRDRTKLKLTLATVCFRWQWTSSIGWDSRLGTRSANSAEDCTTREMTVSCTSKHTQARQLSRCLSIFFEDSHKKWQQMDFRIDMNFHWCDEGWISWHTGTVLSGTPPKVFIGSSTELVYVLTGDRPFHCNQCSYRSITKDQLKRHIEREHENIKYVCHQCDYVAPSRTNLWHHQQKHKKPQAVGCPICSEKFDR